MFDAEDHIDEIIRQHQLCGESVELALIHAMDEAEYQWAYNEDED